MIQVTANRKMKNALEIEKKQDIIVTRYETKTTYNDKGERVEKRIPKKINISKVIKESSKMLKQETAQEVIKKLETMLTK